MNVTKPSAILYRMILFLLVVSVLLSAVSLVVSADGEQKNTVSVSPKRFLTDEINSENASVCINSNQTVTLTINGNSPALSMKTILFEAKTKANALRVVIKNNSLCNSMKIDYTYKNSAQISESSSAGEQYIKPMSKSAEYIVYIPSVDKMTNLSICFSGASAGEIEIISIGVLSVFHDNRQYFGDLSENSYDRELQKATFAGSVSYEMIMKHPNAKVVLYRLAQTEVIEDVRFVHAVVKECPMTLNYKFEFDIENTSDYCSRYFAAILTEDKEVIPLTSETYLKEKYKAGNSGDNESETIVGFKGIETDLYAGASENGTSVSFVDVRLDRMKNESGDGYQYILDDGKEYYFDRAYISELDAEIKSLSSSGAAIYLRFLLDSPSPLFGHFKRYALSSQTKYFALDPQNDETVDNIFAYTDFICSRYSDISDGALKGVILGRSLDKAEEYNYCGDVSMNTYADMLAKTYSIIRIALDRSGSGLEILMPLSDDDIGADVILTAETREADYPADILVRSFLNSLKRYGSDISSMHFMLESDVIPDISSGISELIKDMSANDCADFIDMVKVLSEEYKGLSKEILFCWFPSAELSVVDLMNTYVYNYNFLACTDSVRNYVVSIFEREDQVDIGGEMQIAENYIFSTLKSTYKYIDTNNNQRVSALALEATGKLDWSEIIQGYSIDNVVKRDFFEKDVVYSLPEGTRGSYKMWDFSFANGTGGWSMSDGCTSLSVYTPLETERRALNATLLLGNKYRYGADYGSIVYRAPESLIMRDISAVSFDIFIPSGEYGDIFEVIVTVGVNGALSESSGIIKAGERTDVYADISKLECVEYIKIGVRNLDGITESNVDVRINSISLHSQKYDGEELEAMVLSGEMLDNEKKEEKTTNGGSFITVAVVLTTSILLVVLLWILMSADHRRKN